ncbi:hypothetical protein DFJ73DRAFT_592153 [Zopfochytrium polystomum]|nr:hypothetical protein DFJ73DRAFT_592153 [Zopfochytrium polystomum]
MAPKAGKTTKGKSKDKAAAATSTTTTTTDARSAEEKIADQTDTHQNENQSKRTKGGSEKDVAGTVSASKKRKSKLDPKPGKKVKVTPPSPVISATNDSEKIADQTDTHQNETKSKGSEGGPEKDDVGTDSAPKKRKSKLASKSEKKVKAAPPSPATSVTNGNDQVETGTASGAVDDVTKGIDQVEEGTASVAVDDVPSFDSFDLSAASRKALADSGFSTLAPLQIACLEAVSSGKDVIALEAPGMSRTIAYVLPIVEGLRKAGIGLEKGSPGRFPSAMVLTIWNSVAAEVAKAIADLSGGGLEVVDLFQRPFEAGEALKRGVDVAVGSPFHVVDQISRRKLRVHDLRYICVDRKVDMLEAGMNDTTEKALRLTKLSKLAHGLPTPPLRTLLFAPYLSDWIEKISSEYLQPNWAIVGEDSRINRMASADHYAFQSRKVTRPTLLADCIYAFGTRAGKLGRVLVFVETVQDGKDIRSQAKLKGFRVNAVNEDSPETDKLILLTAFEKSELHCLIIQSKCASGMKIPQCDMLVNYEPPKNAETYTQRTSYIQATGKKGVCLTFYGADEWSSFSIHCKQEGFTVQNGGAPEPEEIARGTAVASAYVSPAERPDLEFFSEAAQALLARFDGNVVLTIAAALASLSDHLVRPIPGGVLTGQERSSSNGHKDHQGVSSGKSSQVPQTPHEQHQTQPQQNRPAPQPYRPEPQTYRPAPQTHRPEPQTYRPEPKTYRPEPQTYRSEPHRPYPDQQRGYVMPPTDSRQRAPPGAMAPPGYGPPMVAPHAPFSDRRLDLYPSPAPPLGHVMYGDRPGGFAPHGDRPGGFAPHGDRPGMFAPPGDRLPSRGFGGAFLDRYQPGPDARRPSGRG